MFDKELVLLSLSQIKSAIEMIIKRASVVKDPNDFLLTQDGMLRLDAICMNLGRSNANARQNSTSLL